MKNIIKRFKKFILKNRIKSCQLRQIELNGLRASYHDQIIKEIWKDKKDQITIDKLEFKRHEMHNKIMELISIEFELRAQLRRV